MTQHPIKFAALGPGDPELITLKTLRALREADAIFCPVTRAHDGSETSRAVEILSALEELTTTREAVPFAQKIVRFAVPMSRERSRAQAAYREVAEEVQRLQVEGLRVCVVAEGDIGFYCSAHYILEQLQRWGIATEQLAGVPAFIAAGAVAQLHTASSRQRLVVVPGSISAEEMEHEVQVGNVVVVMKLSACAYEAHRLMRLHPEFRYDYFERIGTAEERHENRVGELLSRDFPYFSLLRISKE